MAADATIKVTSQTRDRLAELAEEQGLSIDGLLELLTEQHLPSLDLATLRTIHQALPGRSWPVDRAVATTTRTL